MQILPTPITPMFDMSDDLYGISPLSLGSTAFSFSSSIASESCFDTLPSLTQLGHEPIPEIDNLVQSFQNIQYSSMSPLNSPTAFQIDTSLTNDDTTHQTIFPFVPNGYAYPDLPFTLQSKKSSYVCVKEINKGSCGVIFQTRCGHAIKLITEENCSYEELYIMNKVQHPNLMHAIDYSCVWIHFDHDDSHVLYYFIVMPFADSVLYSMPLVSVPFIRKLEWIKDLYCALCTLDNHQYTHGDVHPKNILIINNRAILTDFNLSVSKLRQYSEHELRSLRCCTLPFIDPLSLVQNGFLDFRPEDATLIELATNKPCWRRCVSKADIFAFGQLMCFILFNHHVFLWPSKKTSVDKIVDQHVQYVNDGPSFFQEYFKTQSCYHNIENVIQEYNKDCETSGSLTLASLSYVLQGCLNPDENLRFTLDDIHSILDW